jgi:hypothetical protein
VPVCYLLKTMRAFFVWGHCQRRYSRLLKGPSSVCSTSSYFTGRGSKGGQQRPPGSSPSRKEGPARDRFAGPSFTPGAAVGDPAANQLTPAPPPAAVPAPTVSPSSAR